jgi:hypothetical protein
VTVVIAEARVEASELMLLWSVESALVRADTSAARAALLLET